MFTTTMAQPYEQKALVDSLADRSMLHRKNQASRRRYDEREMTNARRRGVPLTKEKRRMRRLLILPAAILLSSIAAAAQQTGVPKAAPAAKPAMSAAAKIRLATSAAPADVAKGATVMDTDDKGAMKQLRAGTNGWTCMIIPAGGEPEAMCMDKAWSGWADAYMSKKNPPAPKTVGVAYMLRGDHGASNTDP